MRNWGGPSSFHHGDTENRERSHRENFSVSSVSLWCIVPPSFFAGTRTGWIGPNDGRPPKSARARAPDALSVRHGRERAGHDHRDVRGSAEVEAEYARVRGED